MGSAVPWDTNTLGRPTDRGTAKNPGEKAITAAKTSPLDSPTDRAYDAPSDTPPSASRSMSASTRSATESSTSSRKATSGPKRCSAIRSHELADLESGATTITP